ncbi:MAG: hypothetical protein ACI4RA_09690, partial [Kiritimatiellia bacterium]
APGVVTMPEAVVFDGYRWYTGNDSMETRNPVSWTFECSLDGKTWSLIDEQHDRATTDQIRTLAYTFTCGGGEAVDALSDVSPVTLAAGATGVVSRVDETFGPLAGAGVLNIRGGGTARINAVADAVFAGSVEGVGTLTKTGAGAQALSGTVTLTGTLVVEQGVLNLEGAMLKGITNIVLKGGTLAGAATVDGDLTVTSAGGVYAASLAVGGTLTLVGRPTLGTGFAGGAVRGVAFTCGAADDATRALFVSALPHEAIPRGWKFNLKATGTRFAWNVSPGGTLLYIR